MYEGAFHPFDGSLAKFGLNQPMAYLLTAFALVPSWAFMIIISLASRSLMLVPSCDVRNSPSVLSAKRPYIGVAAWVLRPTRKRPDLQLQLHKAQCPETLLARQGDGWSWLGGLGSAVTIQIPYLIPLWLVLSQCRAYLQSPVNEAVFHSLWLVGNVTFSLLK